jgi:NADH-quinone oxidoreductase subunit L
MTHAFFKALLVLGSGSVIHAMAGEQDMRKMGGLKKHLPVTFATMMIGTLAIAGIFPLSGFFSKDEILFRAFVSNKAVWVLAVLTAFMTAFYMYRLMSMTFFGGYRGPAWEMASHKAIATAVAHDAAHPADAFAHGQAQKPAHEVTHGPADTHGHARGHDHDDDYGHGHGAWHGPHESPTPMTFPLMALAVGAIVAGFVGIPAAIGGGNVIEKFLEPSFTAHVTEATAGDAARPAAEGAAAVEGQASAAAAEHTAHEEESVSPNVERGLMLFSLAIAVIGILLARKFYVTSPEISERLADQWAGPHGVLSHKYYVDELYDKTVISGTFAAGRGLWVFDRTVVDGVVNGSGWLTIVSAWFSGLTDRSVVDGLVNLVGRICEEGSFWFRKLQTGLVQNYAMWMLVGIFAFVSIYLFMR